MSDPLISRRSAFSAFDVLMVIAIVAISAAALIGFLMPAAKKGPAGIQDSAGNVISTTHVPADPSMPTPAAPSP